MTYLKKKMANFERKFWTNCWLDSTFIQLRKTKHIIKGYTVGAVELSAWYWYWGDVAMFIGAPEIFMAGFWLIGKVFTTNFMPESSVLEPPHYVYSLLLSSSLVTWNVLLLMALKCLSLVSICLASYLSLDMMFTFLPAHISSWMSNWHSNFTCLKPNYLNFLSLKAPPPMVCDSMWDSFTHLVAQTFLKRWGQSP